jgi:hypothetical protein
MKRPLTREVGIIGLKKPRMMILWPTEGHMFEEIAAEKELN